MGNSWEIWKLGTKFFYNFLFPYFWVLQLGKSGLLTGNLSKEMFGLASLETKLFYNCLFPYFYVLRLGKPGLLTGNLSKENGFAGVFKDEILL